jgi:peptide/nickel transport system substrate-binding protein
MVLVAVLALAMLVIGFGPQRTEAKAPIVVTVVQQLDPTSIDPTVATGVEVGIVNSQHAEQLIRNNDKMQLEGRLAESWEMSEDIKSVTFRLRRGVKFHDGSELTAEDVKFTLDRIKGPSFKSRLAYTLKDLDRVEIVDKYTVICHLKKPTVGFLRNLVRAGGIIPKKVVERVGNKAFANHPIGTGPFKFAEWVKDSHVTFEAFDDYWDGRPKIDRLIFRVIPEASTRVAALLAGEVDVISGITPDQVKSIKKAKNCTLEPVGGLFINFLLLNTLKPPFDNVKVRQAVNYAMDVDSIVKHVYGGYATRLRGLYGDKLFSYDPKSWVYPHDVEKAKKLLAEGGYPNGIDVKLEYPIGGGVTGLKGDVAEVLQAQLAKANIRVTLKPRDSVKYKESIGRRPDIEHVSIGRTTPGGAGVSSTLAIYFDRAVRAFYYHDPVLEKMVRKQVTIRDPKARLALLKEINDYAVKKAVWGPLACPQVIYGVSNRLDWKPRADRNMYFDKAKVKQ